VRITTVSLRDDLQLDIPILPCSMPKKEIGSYIGSTLETRSTRIELACEVMKQSTALMQYMVWISNAFLNQLQKEKRLSKQKQCGFVHFL